MIFNVECSVNTRAEFIIFADLNSSVVLIITNKIKNILNGCLFFIYSLIIMTTELTNNFG